MYARYRQVREYLPMSMRHSTRLNKASLGLGLLSTLGVSIVGNFQVCYSAVDFNIPPPLFTPILTTVTHCFACSKKDDKAYTG